MFDSDLTPINTIPLQCPKMENELPDVPNIEYDDSEVGSNIFIIHTYVYSYNKIRLCWYEYIMY